jgi:hypothetical protein
VGNLGSLASGPVLVMGRDVVFRGGENQLASELAEDEDGPAWVSVRWTGEGILEYCPRRRRLYGYVDEDWL